MITTKHAILLLIVKITLVIALLIIIIRGWNNTLTIGQLGICQAFITMGFGYIFELKINYLNKP